MDLAETADTAKDLDKEITDVFTLLGVLLVFAIALFSALLPIVDGLVRKPKPAGAAETKELKGQLVAYALLIALLEALTIAVFLLLIPLSLRAIGLLGTGDEFPTIRAGLLMVESFLVLQGVSSGWLLIRVVRRRIALG